MTSCEICDKCNKGELGTISEQIDFPRPNGGDYSEIFYFNDNGEPADKSLALCANIHECCNNGEVLHNVFVDFRKS